MPQIPPEITTEDLVDEIARRCEAQDMALAIAWGRGGEGRTAFRSKGNQFEVLGMLTNFAFQIDRAIYLELDSGGDEE